MGKIYKRIAEKPCKLFSELTDETKNASSAEQRCGVNKF